MKYWLLVIFLVAIVLVSGCAQQLGQETEKPNITEEPPKVDETKPTILLDEKCFLPIPNVSKCELGPAKYFGFYFNSHSPYSKYGSCLALYGCEVTSGEIPFTEINECKTTCYLPQLDLKDSIIYIKDEAGNPIESAILKASHAGQYIGKGFESDKDGKIVITAEEMRELILQSTSSTRGPTDIYINKDGYFTEFFGDIGDYEDISRNITLVRIRSIGELNLTPEQLKEFEDALEKWRVSGGHTFSFFNIVKKYDPETGIKICLSNLIPYPYQDWCLSELAKKYTNQADYICSYAQDAKEECLNPKLFKIL